MGLIFHSVLQFGFPFTRTPVFAHFTPEPSNTARIWRSDRQYRLASPYVEADKKKSRHTIFKNSHTKVSY